MIALLLTLSSLAQLPATGPAPLHYRYETKSVANIDMSALGVPPGFVAPQDVTSSSRSALTLTMSDTVGGRLAHLVIDSMVDVGGVSDLLAQGAADMPAMMTASGTGAFYHLYLIDGKVHGRPTPTPMSMQAAEAGGAIAMLFPGIRRMAVAGETWTDTTVADTSIATGSHTTSNLIVRWTVTSRTADSTVLDGEVTSKSTTSTTTAMGAGQMVMEGTGTQHVRFDSDGVARDGHASLRATSTMKTPMGDMFTTVTITMVLTTAP